MLTVWVQACIINIRRWDKLAETYRVRVRPREYKIIKELAEKENITFAEAVERLIKNNQKNIIVGDEVETMEVDDGEGGGNGLLFGVLMAAGFAFLSKYMNNDKGGGGV